MMQWFFDFVVTVVRSGSSTPLPALFLEVVNGFLLIVFGAILWIFARYIVQGIHTYGWQQGRRQRAAAISVFTLILGDFIIRLPVWYWRHILNDGLTVSKELEAAMTLIITVGVLVTAAGGICVIRYFSPDQWGETPWIITMGVALAWSVYMALS